MYIEFGANPKVCEALGPKHCFSSLSIYHSIPIYRYSYTVYHLYRYNFLNIPSLASLSDLLLRELQQLKLVQCDLFSRLFTRQSLSSYKNNTQLC
jgi:hypothetical protein